MPNAQIKMIKSTIHTICVCTYIHMHKYVHVSYIYYTSVMAKLFAAAQMHNTDLWDTSNKHQNTHGHTQSPSVGR